MAEQTNNSKPYTAFIGVSIVLAAILCLFIFYPRDPELLKRARLLAPSQGWIQQYGGYFWISNSDALSFRNSNPGVKAQRMNATSETEQTLTGLTERLKFANINQTANWRLSPDGKWLLWRDNHAKKAKFVVSSLEGKDARSWPVPPYGNASPLWLADNKHWVELAFANNQTTILPVIHGLDGTNVSCAPISGPLTFPVGITPDTKLLTLEFTPTDGKLTWYEFPIQTKLEPAMSHSIALPRNTASLFEAEVSPDGSSIGCLMVTDVIPPLEKLKRLINPTINILSSQKKSLWIINRDGSGKRLLGTEENSQAAGLLWSQDGKNITLYDNGTLYSIPAGR